MKICAVIPAYNEEENIAHLVRRLREDSLDVLVVDDGSTDKTAILARENGAEVLKSNRNQGKGASLAIGFSYVISHNYQAALIMDADGQHLVEDVPLFLDRFKTDGAEVVIGNRMATSRNMPLYRFLTNKFMSYLLSIFCAQDIPDSQCGFRLIATCALKKLRLRTRRFEVESEVLLQLSRSGFKIVSVEVNSVYNGQKSRINPLLDTLRFIKFIIRQAWIG
jgi:glycosyltransferase involved in cell wall biosynthesis